MIDRRQAKTKTVAEKEESMSKKKVHRRKKAGVLRRSKRSRHQVVIILCLLLVMSLVGGIFAQWRARHMRTLLSPAPAPTAPGTPSKEYIYAGGRLLATEEASQSTSAGPTALVATVSSIATQVNLSWTAPAGPVNHYRVERATLVGSFNTFIDSSTTNATDSTAEGTAYLYRVCGVDASGNRTTDYSNIDLATTVIFTDDPLVAHSPTQSGTTIKAEHLVQLRRAVNAVRVLAGLNIATWTYLDPVSEPANQRRAIFWEDITDLRTSLDAALDILGRSQPYTTDPPPTLTRRMVVRKAHFQELRERVK